MGTDRITVTTDPHARRGDAGDCAIARPLRQAYGGDWSVTQSGAYQTDGAGRVKAYRLGWLDRLRMLAFDAGLPMGRRRVTLVRRHRGWLLAWLLPLIVVAWAVGWLLAAGYWWTLALAAWVSLMCVCGLVARSRACEREWAATRAAEATRARTPGSLSPATARTPRRTTAAGADGYLPARGSPR